MKLTKTILITGPAGSGKTHLYEYLKSQGIPAADTDEIAGLGRWVDEVGVEVEYPATADQAWLAAHRYVWNPEVLRAYIRLHAPIVLLGLSHDDAAKFRDFFDRIVYLKVPADVLESRLTHRNNIHGKTEEQRRSVLSYLADFDSKAERSGYLIVDASKSPEEIWQQLLNSIGDSAPKAYSI